MQTIICPNCKKEFEISEALEHEVTEKVELKYKSLIEKAREEEKIKTEKLVKQNLDLKLKDQENEIEESKQRSKKLQEELLENSKLLRELKQKDEDRERELNKKLEEEAEKIKKLAVEEAEKESRNKLAEKEKQLQDALKEAEEIKRKLQQGSQQLQGEAFELEFENLLAKQYPNDIISPVKKGVKGGDIIQEVVDSRGNNVGKIIWELKNTKLWSEGWIDKLKSDKRAINAEEGVLISEVLPNNMKVAGFRNSVWVTQRNFVIPLADTMRAKLIQLHYAKNSVKGKDEKMEILYSYLSGTEFKHRVEAIIDAFTNMQQEIEKEKRYFSNKWARDEKNIRQVIDSTYGMHGDLKGLIGNSLPQIKGIDIPELENGEE